jgi:hypothetical protein
VGPDLRLVIILVRYKVCFYEKAHSVKGQRGGLTERQLDQPKPLRTAFLFAVNTL